MKLIFFVILLVVFCSLMSDAEAAPRRRVIHIRIIRIIPVRRGRRGLDESTAVLPTAQIYKNLDDGVLIGTKDPDTLIYRHSAAEGEVTQEEITRLCDSVRRQVKQTTGEDVDFEVELLPGQ